MADVNLRILLSAVGGAGVTSALNSVSGALQLVGVGAVVGLGVAAVKASADFQQQMLKNQALAGLTSDQYTSMSQQILALSPQLGQAPTDLAKGLYNVLSAGVPASQAMNVLRLATESATIGMTDSATVTDALTSALNAFSVPASQAQGIMDQMNATVTAGKMQWADYAHVVGIVSVTAHESGISFTEANAGLATLTDSGFSAQKASMDLDFLLRDVGLNASKVADTAKKMGLAFDLSKFQSLDLLQKLQYLQQITNGNQAEMLKLTGGATGMAAAMVLLSNNGALYSQSLGNIQKASTGAGATANAWAITQQGLNVQLARAQAAGQALLITLGTSLLPTITTMVSALVPLIMGFATWLTTGDRLKNTLITVGETISAVVGAIAKVVSAGIAVVNFFRSNEIAALALLIPLGALGGYFVFLAVTAIASFIAAAPAMIAGFIAGAAAAWTMAAGVIAAAAPFVLVGAAIGLVIIIVILLVQHWSQVVAFLRTVWAAVASFFVSIWTATANFFVSIWNDIVNFLVGIWNNIVAFLKQWGLLILAIVGGPMVALAIVIATHWTQISQFIQNVWHGIVAFLTGVWNVIKTIALVIFALIVYVIILPFVPLIDFFKSHWTQIHATLTATWNTIKAAAMAVWGALGAYFMAFWTPIAQAFQITWGIISAALSAIWNAIKNAATATWNAISSFFQAIWGPVSSSAQSAWNATSSWLASTWNTIKSTASSIWGNITSAVSSAASTMANNLGTAWSAIQKSFGDAFEALGGIAQSKWNGIVSVIKGAVNNLIRIINGMIQGVNNVTSKVGVPNIPTIPYLARGVTNFGGGLAVVGEAGPELLQLPQGSNVIPLTGSGAGGGRFGGMGQVINFYISIATMARTQAEVSRLVDMFETEVTRRFSQQTPNYGTGNIF